MNPENPWMFCPSKRCGFCGKDISKDATINPNSGFVTGCPNCHHSFVE